MTNHIHLIGIPSHAESLSLALGQAHAQYSLQLNRRQNWVGHVWQNRFFSTPIASSHMLVALRYVDLNPVRAGLVAYAWDWPWSSARAHGFPLGGERLLDSKRREWFEEARLGGWDYTSWRRGLSDEPLPEEMKQLRRATMVGEPFGSEEFVMELERNVGRRLRVFGRGRPKGKKATEIEGQMALFAL